MYPECLSKPDLLSIALNIREINEMIEHQSLGSLFSARSWAAATLRQFGHKYAFGEGSALNQGTSDGNA